MSAIDENSPSLEFGSEAEVKAFSRFFLEAHPYDSQFEFEEQEYEDFLLRRERSLLVQLDHFRDIDFSKSNTISIKDKYYKIVSERHENDPLGSGGSVKKSSRFNYKDEEILQNNVVYFGKTQKCCEVEKFHLEYQLELMRAYGDQSERDELDILFNPIEPSLVYEFDIEVDKILVLTSKPSCDAVSVKLGTYRNEWFEVNDEYEIPSSSQILGTLAKKQGYNGIMYTSVRQQTTPNLVIFEENTGKLGFTQISKKPFKPTLNL